MLLRAKCFMVVQGFFKDVALTTNGKKNLVSSMKKIKWLFRKTNKHENSSILLVTCYW